jgi:glycosyltransferase involved in cell wall biosynthesis
MKASPKSSIQKHGVSVITCTNRRSFIKNLFANYTRQRHPKKELIIVINSDSIPLAPYEELAARLPHVHIYHLPEKFSLGACLNYAVSKTSYGCIAKFDDDDYYAPYYITDSLLTMKRAKADVIGKRAHYMYLRGSKTLLLRFPRAEHRSVTRLPGATLLFTRDVFEQVRFPDQSIGEDDLFCMRAKRKGYKVYSGGKDNFVAIRRKNSSGHTWVISDKQLIAHHRKLANVPNYKAFVRKKPKGLRL